MKKTTLLLISTLLMTGIATAQTAGETQENSLLQDIYSTLVELNPISHEQGDITAQNSPSDMQEGQTEIEPSEPFFLLRTFNIAATTDRISAGDNIDYIYYSRIGDNWCSNNQGPLDIPTKLEDHNGNVVESETFTYYCDTATSIRFEDVEGPTTTGTYTWSIYWDFDAMDNSWPGRNYLDEASFEVTGYSDPVQVNIMPPEPNDGKENLGLDTNPNLYVSTEGNPDIIEWSTGSGETFRGEEFDHKYDSTGIYEIEVESYNEGTNNKDTDTRTVEIEAPTIRAQFYLDSTFNRNNLDSTFTVGDELDLVSSSVGLDLEHEWKGDVQGTGEEITASFDNAGEKDITLQVTDSEGQTDTNTETVLVEHSPPQADFNIEVNRRTLDTTQTVELDASESIEGTTQIIDYEWNVGGRTLTGQTATYQPTDTGDLDVELTVRDQVGLEDTTTETNAIEVVPPTLENLQMDIPSTAETGTPTEFSLDKEASTINAGVDRVIWEVPEAGTLMGETVTPTFETTGNYHIEMQVIDNYGQAKTETYTLSVTEPEEQPSITQRILQILNNLI